MKDFTVILTLVSVLVCAISIVIIAIKYALKKDTKRARFIGGISFCVAIISFIIFATSPNNSNDKKDIKDKTTKSQIEAVEKAYGLSDTQVFDDLEIKINGFKFSDYLGGLDNLFKAKSGYRYCVVYMDVKNVGTSAKQLTGDFGNSNYNFTLYYNGDYKYNSTHADYTDFFYANESIPALGSLKNVCVCFEVPIEVETQVKLPLHIEFSKNSKYDDSNVKWELR